MSEGWGTLPLLPLRCVLDHLSLEDALAALSTCRHWRSTILMYEGHKDTLKLRVKNLEKNLFVTRLFRKYTRNLYVYIDNCGEDLEDFMNFVLPQFFDSLKLQELVFIGPTYIHHQNAPIAKINRIITESLIFKNAHCLQKLILLGCEMSTVKNENDRYLHKNVEYYSRPLSFSAVFSQADAVLTSSNAGLMMFSTLQHIMFDYDLMSSATLETLRQFPRVSQLTLTIGSRRPAALPRVDWRRAGRGLHVVLNIVSVSQNILEEIVDVVLVEGMPLISLKVLFCKTLHAGVLQSVVRHHKASLRELVWADAPLLAADALRGRLDQRLSEEFAMCNVNPLMLLCWQCTQLQRLVIHGYWVWQYDLIGFVRLRASLRALDVSAVYARRGRGGDDGVARVLERDAPRAPDQDLVREVNRYTEFKWCPRARTRLPAALRAHAAPAQRADYVRRELLRAPPAPPAPAAPPAPLPAAHAP